MTPTLSVGGEVFWLAQQRKSGLGFAARHTGDSHVVTAQLATTGLLSVTYVQKVSEKVNTLTIICMPFQVPPASWLCHCHSLQVVIGVFCAQVSLASDFMWNLNAREATASFGYDYVLRQCRLRGRVDTDGKVRLCVLLTTPCSVLHCCILQYCKPCRWAPTSRSE